jgi:hypothetical protein
VSILVNRFGRSELPIYVALFSTLRPWADLRTNPQLL